MAAGTHSPAADQPYGLRGRSVRWLGDAPRAAEGELAVFTSCDPGYLDHAVALVRSLEAFSPGALVVLHVANPRNEDVARAQDLAATLRHTRLHISLEDVDLTDMSAERRRAYFASMRFLRLSEVMRSLGGAVLCVDADSLFVSPLDGDFTNKANAEICLVRREQEGKDTPDHLRVANGSIWIRPTEGALDWLDAVAKELAGLFAGDGAEWFVDQAVVARQLDAFRRRVVALNIKPRYADWEFRQGSVLWAGKGQRKFADLRFVLLQRLLTDQPHRQVAALRLAQEAFGLGEAPGWLRDLAERAAQLAPPRVALYLPRLDQPWGTAIRPGRVPPQLSTETLSLRLPWKELTSRLANAIERNGVLVDVVEMSAWQITPDTVDAAGADLALIPHRCKLDFEPDRTPVWYYMQEYFRWVFVVDPAGWSASASTYPIDLQRLPATASGVYREYRARLAGGRLDSKFGQAQSRPRAELVASGAIPEGDYLFFPLQIPHDQSIRYFSDWSEREVVEAVALWSRARGFTLVFKPHPANLRSMKEFEEVAAAHGARWSTANVHDLIAHARAVFTINSGVGFEALLHGKPVITFGRAEYDAVTCHATPGTVEQAWQAADSLDPAELERRYEQFIDGFLGGLAIDLSMPEAATRRLDALGQQIAEAARSAHRQRRLPAPEASAAEEADTSSEQT